jgi:hypothetical protein
LLAILELQLMQKKLKKSQPCMSEHFIKKMEYQTKFDNIKCTSMTKKFTSFRTIGWLQLHELAVPKSNFKTLLHQRTCILMSEKNTHNIILYPYILMHWCRREWKIHQCFLLIILFEKQTFKQAPWNN